MTPESFIDRNAPALIRTLQTLVRVPTINPPGVDYDVITRILMAELRSVGLDAKRYPIPKQLMRKVLPADQQAYPRFNVLGKLRSPGAKRTIHFNAHYDVVPVSGKWRLGGPFSGGVEAGWIHGRGTADMKGSIASLLLALRALKAAGANPRMNVEVSFTADEETDSALGAAWLVAHAPIDPDYAIVMEGGELSSVCCGHNGVVWLEVTVHGRAAHGSTPEKGINALEKMSALVLALEDFKKRLARRGFRVPEAKGMRPTLNLGGMFESGPGGKINTVPSLARFTIDRRVLACENHGHAERELRGELASAASRVGARISVAKVSENFACYSPPTDPFFAATAESVTRVRRRPTTFAVSTGFNDMHFFAHHLKIPTLGYGPGGKDYHAVDERARISDLENTAKIYADLLTRFAG